MRVRVKVPAGPHEVTAAFVDNMAVKDTVRLQPFLRSSADNFDWAGRPHIQTFAVTGPFDADRPGRHAEPPRRSSRCRPAVARRRSAPAPRRFSAGWRAAPTASRSAPPSSTPILEFYDAARAQGSFEAGIQRGLQRILASPRFVFRVERDPAGAAPGTRPSRQRTSSWRRGCRSSCGAAFRTRRC